MFRKCLSLAASSAAIVLTLAGCAPAGEAGSADGEKLRLAMVTQIEGIPYYAGFEAGAQRAAEEFGVEYTQTGPSRVDSAEQVRVFDSLVGQEYDAIVISPLDATSLNPSIATARARGITVITSDADAPNSERQIFVSQATDEALGAGTIDEIAKGIGGSGEYAIVSGSADTQTFINWIAAMDKRQKEAYPDMTLVGGIRHTLDSEAALSEAQNLMTAFPNLKGIIAIPSTAVPGVGQAVQNAGKAGQITVTGFGSPQTAGPFLETGAITSTVFWDAEQLGYLTVWAMVKLLNGETLQANNEVPGFDEPVRFDEATKVLLLGDPIIVTKENYNNYAF